jgi:hypothetical protein
MTPAMVEAVAMAIWARTALPEADWSKVSEGWRGQLDGDAKAAIQAMAAFCRSAPVGTPDEILQQLVPVLRATGGGGYADAIESLFERMRDREEEANRIAAKLREEVAHLEKRLIAREEEADRLIKTAERERDDARMARDVEHDVAERMRARIAVASAQLARMEKKALREGAEARLAEKEPNHPESPERCTDIRPKHDRPIEYLAARGAEAMLAKLRENAHKPGWRSESRAHLLTRLREEYMELHDAIVDGKPNAEVWREAADVANLAFMVADHVEMVGRQGRL